jgi:hypothetical protein
VKIVKAIQLLINESRMNRVYAGKGIAVSRGPRGTLVSCLETEGGGGGGGGAFAGFFTVVDATTEELGNRIRVIDGTGTLNAEGDEDDEGRVCGIFVSGVDTIAVANATLAVASSGYVLFHATYAPATEGAAAAWTVWFTLASALPTFTSAEFTAIIAHVAVEDGKISGVKQLYNDGVLYNNRYS